MTAPKPSPPPQRWRTEHLNGWRGRQVTPVARQAEINRELARRDEDNEDDSTTE